MCSVWCKATDSAAKSISQMERSVRECGESSVDGECPLFDTMRSTLRWSRIDREYHTFQTLEATVYESNRVEHFE